MPVQQAKPTGLLAKLGNKLTDAQAKHRGRAPEVGNPQLPAGIENGIAHLVECKIDVYKEGANKGQPFFMASGIVDAPDKYEGVTVRGRRTTIGPEPLCDTPTRTRKTFADHYGWMRDQLYILGFDIDNLAGSPEQVEQQLLQGMSLLKGNPKDPTTWVHFNFRTWKGADTRIEERNGKWFAVTGNRTSVAFPSKEACQKMNPYADQPSKVNHEWNGRCDFTEDLEAGGDVVDDTAAPPPTSNGTANQPTMRKTLGKPAPKKVEPPVVQEETETVEPTVTELGDDPEATLNELAEGADQGDAGCQASLTFFGDQHGIPADVEVNNWGEFAKLILEAIIAALEAAGDTAAAPEGPNEGDMVKHRPVNKITKKPAPKAIDCEVLAVDREKRTVTLKNGVDGKTEYKAVSWDALE